jgi:hypothetical protein
MYRQVPSSYAHPAWYGLVGDGQYPHTWNPVISAPLIVVPQQYYVSNPTHGQERGEGARPGTPRHATCLRWRCCVHPSAFLALFTSWSRICLPVWSDFSSTPQSRTYSPAPPPLSVGRYLVRYSRFSGRYEYGVV